MIDIFNIDKWHSSIGDELRPYFNHKIIKETINKYNNSIEAKNLNLYINNGVIKTRGFHVDGYEKQLKGFIYLEDCLDLKYGPYIYAEYMQRSTCRLYGGSPVGEQQVPHPVQTANAVCIAAL